MDNATSMKGIVDNVLLIMQHIGMTPLKKSIKGLPTFKYGDRTVGIRYSGIGSTVGFTPCLFVKRGDIYVQKIITSANFAYSKSMERYSFAGSSLMKEQEFKIEFKKALDTGFSNLVIIENGGATFTTKMQFLPQEILFMKTLKKDYAEFSILSMSAGQITMASMLCKKGVLSLCPKIGMVQVTEFGMQILKQI